MQLSVIRSRARSFLNEPTEDYYLDTELTGWVNDAYHLIESETEYTEVIKTDSTVANQQSYDLPTDWDKINLIYWEDDPLDEMDWDRYVRYKASQDLYGKGDPEEYVRWNKKVLLVSVPPNSATTALLDGQIAADTTTTISVDSTSGFPLAGRFKVGSEVISYANRTATAFSDCTRAEEGTTAAIHADGSTITERDITFIYTGISVDLSSDADVPNIPSQYHILLAFYAAWMGFLKSKSLPEAREFEGLFERKSERMKHKLRLKRTNYPTVKDAASYGLERP